MKKRLATLALILCLSAGAFAQTHVGAMLDGTQPFTATQTFQSFIDILWGDTGSTANNYNFCPLGLVVPSQGTIVAWDTAHANTGASTIQICGGTAFPITKQGLTALAGGEILANQVALTYFDGANWQLLNPATSGATFKTNGNANDKQSGLDIESSNSLNCQNSTGTDAVSCEVQFNILPLSVTTTMAPDTGSANTYSGCTGFPNPAMTAGLQVALQIANGNTGASTFNLCGLGAEPIVKAGASAIISGDLIANQVAFMVNNGSQWQLLNPSSTASGTVANQQRGQPTIGSSSSSTLTTEPAVFVAQAMAGSDLCAKINAALLQCPTGSNNSCRILVDATSPGSVDICAAGTSNFWSGVNSQVIAKIELNTILQLKQPVIYPAAAHITTGIGSNQNFRGAGFRMDPTFSDPGNNCVFSGSGQGPFPAGTYNCLIIDGGTTGSANGFGGLWRNVLIDCNFHVNCIGYYTLNMQEGSGLEWIRCWGTGANTGSGSVSACGFWDHSASSSPNSGPSHFRVKDSFIDPWANTTGNNTNGTAYGWVVEDNGGSSPSGGNVLFQGGTIRGANSTACGGSGNCFIEDGIWIDGGTSANVEDVHFEWINTDAVFFKDCQGCKASNITDVNHSSTGVHFDSASGGGVAFNITAGGAEVKDDANSCTTAGSSLEFYTQDDGGQGWWENGFHVCGTGNTDRSGNLSFSSSTSVTSQTFNGTYATTGPQCALGPTFTAAGVGFWYTWNNSTNQLTIHSSSAVTGSVTYQCSGRGN
jgi:hypothetical protein